MKKVFLIVVGVLFVFGATTDALAHSKTRRSVGEQKSHNLNGFEDKVEFVSRRHHRSHRHGHFRGHRHGPNCGHGIVGHRNGLHRRHFGGLHLHLYPRHYNKHFGNYTSGGYSYRGRRYDGYKNHNRRHHRGYGYGPHYYSNHRY